MSRPLARPSARRLAAICALAALFVGVPAALFALAGNPLPGRWPSLDAVVEALEHGTVADTTIVKVLAGVCWLAWLQLVSAVGIELITHVRGSTTRAVPVPRSLRRWAAVVVAAALATGATRIARDPAAVALHDIVARGGGSGSGAPPAEAARPDDPPPVTPVPEAREPEPAGDDAGPHRPVPVGPGPGQTRPDERDESQRDGSRRDERVPRPPAARPPGADDPAGREPGTDEPPVRGRLHRVGERETLWSVAAERLGDPLRWRELFEVNRDRLQPDGGRLERPDQALRPGWELLVPAPSAGAPPVADAGPPPEGDTSRRARAVDDPDDPLPVTVAETHSPAMPGVHSAPAVRGPEHQPPSRHLPAAEPHTVRVPDGEPPSASPGLREAEPSASPGRSEGRRPGVDPLGLASFPVRPDSPLAGVAGAGIFAAGLVTAIERRRERRDDRRSFGEPVVPARPAESDVELALRSAAQPERLAAVHATLEHLAARALAAGRDLPAIVGVNVSDEISLLLAHPEPDAFGGFRVDDGGYSWAVDPGAPGPSGEACLSGEEGGGPPGRPAPPDSPPLPLLVGVGHTAHSQVFLNLDHAGVLAVTGADADVDEALFCVAAELATAPWADGVELVVGSDTGLASLPRTRPVGAFAGLAGLEAREGREEGDGGNSGRVLVGGRGSSSTDHDALVHAVMAGAARAAVVASAASRSTGRWRLHVEGGEARLLPVDVTLRRPRLAPPVRSAVECLLDPADPANPGADLAPAGHAATVGPASYPGIPAEPAETPGHRAVLVALGSGAATRADRPVAEARGLEVQVLGPVGVDGAGEFARRKALELVVFLAVHRRGVDAESLAGALWPDRLVTPGTLHSAVSMARRALGPEGGELLPSPAGGLYRLDPAVTLDHDRFTALVEHARRDGDRAADHLARGLEMVRGRPFASAGGEYLWAQARALVSAVTAEVVDAAHALCHLALDSGDVSGAWWATRQGLLACPGNEQLHRDRMVIADLRGDPDAVEQVMEELCAAIDVDRAEREEVLHPRTLDLYGRLSRRSGGRVRAVS